MELFASDFSGFEKFLASIEGGIVAHGCQMHSGMVTTRRGRTV